MKQLILAAGMIAIPVLFSHAQVERNQNVNRAVQPAKNLRMANLGAAGGANLSEFISTTQPTELYGYVVFLDPSNNEKHMPAGTGGLLAGTADVRMVYRSLSNPSDSLVDYIGNLYTAFYFKYFATYLQYKIMIKPSPADVYPEPYYQTGSIIYNPNKWKLERFELVWRLWDPQSGSSSYDPSLFLDKIIKENTAKHGEVLYFPLHKRATLDNSLPAF